MHRINRPTIRNPLRHAEFSQQVDLALDTLLSTFDIPSCQIRSGLDPAVPDSEPEGIGEGHRCVYALVEFRRRESVEDANVAHDGVVFVNQRDVVLAEQMVSRILPSLGVTHITNFHHLLNPFGGFIPLFLLLYSATACSKV
jgi:hypothetical protein